MNALSKAIIVETLFNEFELPKSEGKNLVEMFFETIKSDLESGKSVKLSGFGNFTLRDKLERPGRNPKTGIEIPIKARRVVTFKPGLKLKKAIHNEYFKI